MTAGPFPIPKHHLPTEEFVDAAGATHQLAFSRPDSLVGLKTIMPALGFLLGQGEQKEGGSINRLLASVFAGEEAMTAESSTDRIMERLAEEVVESGDENLTIALLAHVTMDDRNLNATVLKTLPVVDLRGLVLLVLRRDYAPFFMPRIARSNALEAPLYRAAREWLQKNGLDSALKLALRLYSSTPSGSPTEESPTTSSD